MKRYVIFIKPTSKYSGTIKGDTLFGQYCWQLVHDSTLLDVPFDSCVGTYSTKPFVIFSSAFPAISDISDDAPVLFLKRPDIPGSLFPDGKHSSRNARIKQIKDLKKKRWVAWHMNQPLSVQAMTLMNDSEVLEQIASTKGSIQNKKNLIATTQEEYHNRINRLTQSTGGHGFDPFYTDSIFFHPALHWGIVTLLDTSVTDIERVCIALERIGQFGYGRDASVGYGKFDLISNRSLDWDDDPNCNAIYTMAPCVPPKNHATHAFFLPFTRFGKHGDQLATSRKPFKNPVIMADEGAVFWAISKEMLNQKWFGVGLQGVSQVNEKTIVQGYCPTIPITMEVKDA